MSVLGVGIDLVQVRDFEVQLGAAGTSFAESTFTSSELADARRAADRAAHGPARHLAARFAAKEALVKAWSSARSGRPPAMAEVAWQEIEVVTDDWGRPSISLRGRTASRVEETLGAVTVDLSITHEDPVAAAVVVMSGTPGVAGATAGDGSERRDRSELEGRGA